MGPFMVYVFIANTHKWFVSGLKALRVYIL
jgi:hypothetical protein